MSRRVSFWGGLSLSLLMLGGCLLADVGIDPQIDEDVDRAIAAAQGGGSGSAGQLAGAAGNSGSSSLPASSAAGAGGGGGSEGNPVLGLAGQGGAGGSAGAVGAAGSAGSGGMPPNPGAAGTGGGTGMSPGELAAMLCPDGVDRETACAQYCDAYAMVCRGYDPLPGVVAAPYTYTDPTQCAIFCNLESGWELGTNSTLDSIKCRCYHSVLAIVQGKDPHCYHAAQVPSGGCQAAP